MWQKAALAFLIGAAVAGTAVYVGMQAGEGRQSGQVSWTAPAGPPPAAPEVVRPAEPAPPQPAGAAAQPEPRQVERGSSRRGASRQEAASRRQPEVSRKPQETAQTSREGDVIVVPPPVPAPPPAIPSTPSDQGSADRNGQVSRAEAAPAETAKPVPKREPRTVTIPAGTLLTVRLRDALSTARQSTDDSFVATLDAPLIVEGLVIAERGALVRGRIVEAVEPGRVKGRAALVLQLTELSTSDGQKVEIRTDAFRHEAESTVRSDMARTGVAAGIGAALGAIIGGGKGAAIGGAVGGAAGAGGVLATRGKQAELPSETRLTFRLSEPVTLTEKLP